MENVGHMDKFRFVPGPWNYTIHLNDEKMRTLTAIFMWKVRSRLVKHSAYNQLKELDSLEPCQLLLIRPHELASFLQSASRPSGH